MRQPVEEPALEIGLWKHRLNSPFPTRRQERGSDENKGPVNALKGPCCFGASGRAGRTLSAERVEPVREAVHR